MFILKFTDRASENALEKKTRDSSSGTRWNTENWNFQLNDLYIREKFWGRFLPREKKQKERERGGGHS